MNKAHALLFALMMITASLAGCLGGDVEDDTINTVEELVEGCTNSTANNYNPNATDEENTCDYDLDDDGVLDADEIVGCMDSAANNYNPNATDEDITCDYDLDGDGIEDAEDTDDDNDGFLDIDDPCPNSLNNATSEMLDVYSLMSEYGIGLTNLLAIIDQGDTDDDGCFNLEDTDDDGDGIEDLEDSFPLDSTEYIDDDGDGIGNNADTDDDGDGIEDLEDAFPLDHNEDTDNDGDGIGNNADTDDDGDGVLDYDEILGCTDSGANNYASIATDDDGLCDYDLDDDGVLDADEVSGCTIQGSLNFNSFATDDDDSCLIIIKIDAGYSHTCAILDDGSVWCWGANYAAQLGNGTATGSRFSPPEGSRSTPAPTSSLGEGRTAVDISAGMFHTCAILDDGSVSCWGMDFFLGHESNGSSDPLPPTQTASLGEGRTAVKISAGTQVTCAILDDGSVVCWGQAPGSAGKIGDGTGEERASPTQTASFGDGRTATEISVGSYHACAILDDGSVVCWGENNFGNLGTRDLSESLSWVPVQTASLGDGRTAVAISAGAHTCAILDDGSVVCWGENSRGSLGTEYAYDSCVPNYSDDREDYFSCSDEGWDWTNGQYDCIEGNDDKWVCRTNSQSAISIPVPTQTASLGEGRTAVALINSDFYATCVILDDGSVSCWGFNGHGQIGNGEWGLSGECDQPSYSGECHQFAPTQTTSLGDGRSAVSIVAGYSYFLVILDDGTLRSWGQNNYGQLGNCAFDDLNEPSSPW